MATPESSDWIMIEKEVDETGHGQTGLAVDAELDLCFICDCTGSMGQYIKAAQENIQSIVTKISGHGEKVRFGLISYRDHPPQDSTFVTQCHPFTENLETMRQYVDTMRANGGGDGPEAVTAALFEALSLPWRPNATKICVLIADAPPHGLEPSGDGFPNGDPDGRDPLEILRDMATLGITVYTVGCEPALGAYHFARDFLCNVAEVTGGQAVALSSAAMLADVIINGSAEEIGLSKLQRQVEEEVLKVQTEARSAGHNISTEASVTAAVASLQARGLTSVQMETDGRMTNATKPCWGNVLEKKSLAKVKEELGKFAATVPSAEILPSCLRSARLPGPSMPRGYAGASAPPVLSGLSAPTSAKTNLLKTDLISGEQVSRIVQRAQCQNRLL
ncbi:unnamed protein product [Durusdinium trenchii]|uniref:Alpha-protein kinase vwkA (von Willebrand factor A alpha-kinase) (vWF kinase) n=2 Tax=Durusdinium trenchii TaxID=1381693 RepID=A0ABP0PLX2_9DINO